MTSGSARGMVLCVEAGRVGDLSPSQAKGGLIMARARLSFVRAALLLATVGMAASCSDAGEEPGKSSGPPVGARLAAFGVHAVTGPQKGMNLCYI